MIEVRGGVGRSALAVVAMIALTYFTFGGGAIAGFTLGTSTALGTLAVQSGVYIAGSMLINKVLAPKPPKAVGQQQDSVYSITGARNQLRPYDPLPLLFGRVRLTPDLLSKPYTWYEGNDQYLGMLLCAGINVGRVEDFYNGDTLLSSYEGAQVFHAGYSQMPEQAIPLYSNADVIDGGQLIDTGTDPKHHPSAWVERTGSVDTVRLVVAIEYQLYDKTSKGKDKNNTERVEIQYRPTGTTSWLSFGSYTLNSNKTKLHRVGYAKDVARGQYDVRVRTAGLNTDGSGAQAVFAWTTLTSVQVDEADYTGISRSGVKLKATGQLNGSPDELRAIGYADPIPVWTGTEWVTQETSNPGAQILAYGRGIVREGRLLGGMALSDAQIDIESLKAFSLHCAANGYRYDFLIKDARNHDQVLAAIALAGFGQITWAGGRLGVVWAAQEQPLSGVVNMATIKKGQFQVDYTLSNAADGIEYAYADGDTWETKTIRVPAPGVTTMLNPAQVTGEGVTTEEHAARLARWHLAQSLYQYKDISYSTDIEHLSYQRLSVLAMQHDMTQWGFGGRIVAATSSAGVVTLHLDEPVPGPTTGSAYIGVRIPGERVYRVLRVKPFSGESNAIDLLEAWPDDAALPGATEDNPPDDTLWFYDVKQTPGLRVRVVSVEPESDLKGASVRVVAEGPEFWNYVLTGNYVPSPGGSQLQTRPIASNLAITEQQTVQGDTVFTELTAAFDVTGPVGNIIVQATGQEGELREVAQTRTRTATWRIPQADVYTIVVRPYSPEGEAGVAVSKTYATIGADVPPVLVDLFDVQERSGGVRLYTWGWLQDTIQSADFAGVEVRFLPGAVAQPDWTAMTPIGEGGYHTVPFEAVVPAAGVWTFACRSRNTAGELSTGMRVVSKQLGQNLGEQMQETWEEAERANQRIGQEIIDRLAGDLEAINKAVSDARQYTDTQVAALNGILEDIVGADEWTAGGEYPKGDFVRHAGTLYQALLPNTGVQPGTDPTTWREIGDYTSVGDALAAAISMSTQNATDISAQAVRIDAVVARLPGDGGAAASAAQVASQIQALAEVDTALAQRLDTTSAELAGKASSARVEEIDVATVARDEALAQSLAQTNTALEGKASAGALQLLSSEVQQLEDAVSANSTAITEVKASTIANPNMIANPTWRSGFASWTTPASGGAYSDASFGPFAAIHATTSNDTSYQFIPGPITPGRHTLSGEIFRNGLQGNARLAISAYNNDGLIGSVTALSDPTKLGVWTRYSCTIDVPAGTTRLLVGIICEVTDAVSSFRRLKLEQGAAPTVWSDEVTVSGTASATQALEVRATTLENGQSQMFAKYTWALDVNGRAIGMTSVNNGTIGRIDFVADRFGIVDPNNTGSTTFEGGRWLTRSGGLLLAYGKPFGTAGDLLFWIGVGSDVDACSKANGLLWFDNKGAGFFGGSLSAGIRRNAYRSTAVSTTATVESPPFGTGGGPKTVVFSLAYYNSGYLDSGTPGVVANSVIMTLQRSYNGGAWQTLTSMQVGGQTSVYYDELWGRYSYEASVGGSVTFTDGLPGTGTFAYRVLLSGAAGLWPITLAEANGSNFHIGSQELSLISTEG
ncbi:hypothetical protein G9274_002577 [Stenotrophomonas rhizophila]|nr:hypothetical protein G9274_002577 [Stenotrophomonas rhizophila]